MIDSGRPVLVRRLHDTRKTAIPRHWNAGGREHRLGPVLASTQRQRLTAGTGEPNANPLEQGRDLSLQIGPAKRSFAEVKDHIRPMSVQEREDFAGSSVNSGA